MFEEQDTGFAHSCKVGPAEIEIVRNQGYAGNLYVRTFAEVSDNLCHGGAIFGGFKQLWLAVGLDKLDWRTEKSRVVEVMHLTRNEHQETEGAYGRRF